MPLAAVRGAITTENDSFAILNDTKTLLSELFAGNNISNRDVIAIFFSVTRDLDEAYPALAAREMGLVSAALMCFQEQYVKNSLEKCVRVMVQFITDKSQDELKHVYMKEAVRLRPDLSAKGL
jgi:monofunctional chorismate mutase